MSLEFENTGSTRAQIYRSVGQGLKVFHNHSSPDLE